jgi:hypothetical protein
LAFEPHLTVSPEGDAKVTLGVHNISVAPLPPQESFGAEMRIRNEEGAVLARVEAPSLERLGPGQQAFPVGWEGALSPGSYQLTWGASGFGYTQVRFSVVEGAWTMIDVNLATGAGEG